MNKQKGYIYCYTNLINGKQYIGSTTAQPNIRYNQHKYNSIHEASPKYNYPLYKAFRKYGIENFSYQIIQELICDELELRKIEHNYILLYNCLTPNGYNQTLNTEHPLMDDQIRKKVSETKRIKAKKVVEIDENNNIIQIWRSVADCAEEQLLNPKNLAACCRGEQKTISGRTFRWLNDDNTLILPKYDKFIYKGAKGTTQIQSTSKKVAKLDEQDNIIKIYDTIALAARENNCDSSGITKVCKNIRKKCGGFKWKYVE